ncbi:MAG: hypothetical protein BGO11_21840 [Solirubrobacterales bacterium 70-9]|nr:MAG: hypothetical protein BGO11_21840 [Solirubrobacterales bacterium 70-9]
MSILDDAIREHLELKRAHGADEGELKKLEDEAFGPPQRPDEIDPFDEAPTEFLLSPDQGAADAPAVGDEAARGGRRPDIADLQEAPPIEPETGEGDAPAAEAAPATGESDAPPTGEADAAPPTGEAAPPGAAPLFNADDELSPAPDAPPPSPTDAAEVPLPPPPDEAPAAEVPPPASEEALPPLTDEAAPAADDATAPPVAEEAPAPPAEGQPAAAHEIVPDAGPDTDERHVIADQPTQMFDVQSQIDAEAPATPTEQESPSDEELVDAAQSQPPRLAPPAPEEDAGPDDAGPPTELHEQPPLDTRGPDAEVAGHPPTDEESAEFDFFNEQRLSDELDQALEAPITDERPLPEYEDGESQPGIFDFERERRRPYEEDPSEEVLRRHDAPEPPSEEYEQPAEEMPRGGDRDQRSDEEDDGPDYDPDTGHEDVLEDTPRFLEDAPEDDDLWFEQKPPKDFDLD